jgi:hypothetical protein
VQYSTALLLLPNKPPASSQLCISTVRQSVSQALLPCYALLCCTVLQLHYFALNKPPGYICSNVSHNSPGKRAADLLQPWLDDWQQQHKVSVTINIAGIGQTWQAVQR